MYFLFADRVTKELLPDGEQSHTQEVYQSQRRTPRETVPGTRGEWYLGSFIACETIGFYNGKGTVCVERCVFVFNHYSALDLFD